MLDVRGQLELQGRVKMQECPPRARAALKSLRAIPNPRPEDRRPKETRRPRSELIATPAEQQPIELGHARNSELPPITQIGADNKAGRLRHCVFPICEYRRHLRLRNSEFGLLSGFGLRSSDFRLWSDGGVGTQSLGLKIARNRRSFRRSVRQWTRTEYPKGIGSIPSGIGCLVRAPTAT